MKADLDALAKAFGMRHYAANLPCPLCPCDRGNVWRMNYNNFESSARWKSLLYNALQWKTLVGDGAHYLFQLGFMSCLNVEPDELHIMHLGTSMYLLGSVLWLLCYQVLQAGSPKANMDRVWATISNYYKQYKVAC